METIYYLRMFPTPYYDPLILRPWPAEPRFPGDNAFRHRHNFHGNRFPRAKWKKPRNRRGRFARR